MSDSVIEWPCWVTLRNDNKIPENSKVRCLLKLKNNKNLSKSVSFLIQIKK